MSDAQNPPTDAACLAALEAYSPDIIQGFHYGDQFVIRNLRLPRDQQIIWSGPAVDHEGFQKRVDIERMRLALTAARAADTEDPAAAFLLRWADDLEEQWGKPEDPLVRTMSRDLRAKARERQESAPLVMPQFDVERYARNLVESYNKARPAKD